MYKLELLKLESIIQSFAAVLLITIVSQIFPQLLITDSERTKKNRSLRFIIRISKMKIRLAVALLLIGSLDSVQAQVTNKKTVLYQFTTIAGGTGGHVDGPGEAAKLHAPEGIAVDKHGNIYVTEYRSTTIRKITPDGMVSTLAGKNGELGSSDGPGHRARFNRPHGITVDSDCNVFICDMKNHTIRKISPDKHVSTVAGIAGMKGAIDGDIYQATFNQPEAIVVSSNGTLYVADTYNYTIRKITPDGKVTTLAGTPGKPGSKDGPGSDALFNRPIGLAIDDHDNLYVADSNYDGALPGNCTIRKITPDGKVSTLAGTPGETGNQDGIGSMARFDRPVGIAVDNEGFVFIADTEADLIRMIHPDGQVSTIGGVYLDETFSDGDGIEARFADPQAIAVDNAGNLYIADTFNNRIRKGILVPTN